MKPVEHPGILVALEQARALSDDERASVVALGAEDAALAVTAIGDMEFGGEVPAHALEQAARVYRGIADALDRIAAQRKAGAS